MRYKRIAVKDKYGNNIELRNAEVHDAESIIVFLKITNAESPYLICEPEEITLSIEQEKEILCGIALKSYRFVIRGDIMKKYG